MVSTHNLTSVSEYCDYTVLVKGTVLASGPVATTFTPENIKRRLVQTLRVSQIYCQFREDQHSQIINLPLNMKIKAGHHELASGAFWLSIHAQCHVDFGNGRRNMCFLSCYLMLKGWSLIGDALSHSIVPGVAGALCWDCPSRWVRLFLAGWQQAACSF